nr:hypothetical protein [Desulfofundulus australicus]
MRHKELRQAIAYAIDAKELIEKVARGAAVPGSAMVFQNSLEVLNPVLSIGEQIGEPLRAHYITYPPWRLTKRL